MLIDDSEFPCLVFVIVRDKELIDEFGDEITLKTDFEKLLPQKDDHPAINAIREDIFAIAKNTTPFLNAKERWTKTNELLKDGEELKPLT